MSGLVVIGKVLKPRGLKGELKCHLSIASQFDSCLIENILYKILKSTSYDGFTYLFLDKITTIEQAERLRNKSIEVEWDQIVLAEDEVLASDLIGFEVVSTNGKRLGTVMSIDNFGAGNIIVSENFSFPYEDEFIVETNMKIKQIVVHDKMLEMVSCE